MLENELRFYERIRNTLPAGQFVVIRGEELVGIFSSESQALSEGARRFGREPYLVRQVRDQEHVYSNPALSLGILRATSTSHSSR